MSPHSHRPLVSFDELVGRATNTPPVAGSRPIKYAPTFLGRVTETSNRITEAAGLETDLDPDSFRDPPQPGDLIYRRVSYAVAEETDPALLRWLGPLCSACLIDAEEPSWCEDRFVFDQCEGAFPEKPTCEAQPTPYRLWGIFPALPADLLPVADRLLGRE